jgi:Cu(I)/Ag(I) efflux system periplasmic protein CusF
MNLKTLMMAAVFGLTLSPVLALAETDSRGVITEINAEKRKVTLNHEPIPELNWPRMTMGFSVAPDVELEGLSKGDAVTFTLKPAGKGQQVTAINKQ